MILDETEVIQLIEEGVSDYMRECSEYAKKLNMHITGKDAKRYAEELNNHESLLQKKVREKLLKSNKGLFSFLSRPIDKVFTAKGGSIIYNLSEDKVEDVKALVSDVSDGLDLKTYLRKKVKPIYTIDPNGFVMVDIDSEGDIDTNIYTTDKLHWYAKKGNQLEAVIFAPYESDDEDDKKLYFRVLDDATDSIYIQDGDNVYLDEESVIPNYFGYVPAYILGDIICPNTGMFLSIFDDVIEDAEEFMRDNSVRIVHKLSHGFAKYWQYPEACTTCGGSGVVKIKDSEDNVIEDVCHTCGGGGLKDHKDASDMMIIDIPQEGETKITPEVGGYINPSIEIWKQYKEDLSDLKSDMYHITWGTIFDKGADNDTATASLIDVQPEAERVASISRTFSNLHEFLLDAFGRIVIGNKTYKSNVSYGTRYLMEKPDEILTTLRDARTDGLPVTLQQELLDKFYQTEYAHNSKEYNKAVKLLNVDPFPLMTATEVKDLGITGIDLYKKIYYPQWVNQLPEAKKILMTDEELRSDLSDYVNKIVESLKINLESEIKEE